MVIYRVHDISYQVQIQYIVLIREGGGIPNY